MVPEKELNTFRRKYETIQPTIRKLLFQEPISSTDYSNVFADVHWICSWIRRGPKLLLQALKNDINNRILSSKRKLVPITDNTILLKMHMDEWNQYFDQINYIEASFTHLDAHLRKHRTIKSGPVRQLMINSWREVILLRIDRRIISSAMEMINEERNHQSFNPDLINRLRDCLIVHNPDKVVGKPLTIGRCFENHYIAFSESFYRSRGYQYLQENGIYNYLKYAKEKLIEEEARGHRYVDSVLSDVLVHCYKELIDSFKDVITAECSVMLRNNDTENLQVLFWCVDRVEGHMAPILAVFEEFIVNVGLADMVAEAANIVSDSCKYVEKLLNFFKRFGNVVKTAFNDDSKFLTAADKAFRRVINDVTIFKLELPTKNRVQPESKSPSLLANYCDSLLRKTTISKKLTANEIESSLKEVIFVLKYVQNKDVFMQYYTSHLTRRLILQTSIDNEKEENMVRWLRDIGMPSDFFNKMTQMFQDIKVSEDFSHNFKQNHNYSIDVNAKILNASAWKVSEKMEITVPFELEKFIFDEEKFYKGTHNGRKLQWNHNMSTVTISFQNSCGKYDVDVTSLQMTVLCAWNQQPDNKISYENLRMTTLLPDAELRRTIWSLVAFPHLQEQILLSSPEAKSSNDFKDNTKFAINRRFAVYRNNKPQKRGKINLIGRLQLSTEKTNREDNEAIVALRILRTQEAIVRILKWKKTCTVAQLQMEVVDILKNIFLPTISTIKEQIEYLIENEYIQRDDKDMSSLIYIS